MSNDDKPFMGGELTVREVAERLNVTIQFVYTLIWQKQLVSRKHDDGRWLISEESVRARERDIRERDARRDR